MAPDPQHIDTLVVLAQNGDRNAFRDVIMECQRSLRIYVSAFADSRDQVDEVMQEVFVTAFEKLGRYEPRGAFLAWLKTIARNHLIDQWRERRRLSSLDEDIAECLVADAELQDLDGDEGHERRQVLATRLAHCLERLPARSRVLVERRHLHGRSLAEMAQQFKRPVEAMSVMLHRIRVGLRRCIETAT